MRSAVPALALAAALLAPAPAAGEDAGLAEAEKLLQSGVWKSRIEGLEKLEAAGPGTRAEALAIRTLSDEDWEVAIRAVKTVVKVAPKGGRDALVRLAVEGEIRWVRDAAVEALRGLDAGEAAADLLAVARSVRDEEPKARAVEAAGRVGGATALEKFHPFLQHRSPEVVAAAVRAVGRLGREPAAREQALSLLEAALALRAERKYFLAYAAVLEGLGGIDSPRARALLVQEVLRQPDEDGYAPERIARGLASMDAAAVAEAIRPALARAPAAAVAARRLARLAGRVGCRAAPAELEALLAHRSERVRSEAARALGLLRDPAAAPALRALLSDPSAGPFARREAVTALARLLAAAEFREVATGLAGDGDDEVRLQAVVEMADAMDPAAIPLLARLGQDRSWRVASAAVATVGTLGVASDLPLLEPLRVHKDWRIRGAAFEAMGRLRAAAAIPLLADGLEDRDPVVKGVCLANLQILTRERLSPDPKAWREWWAGHGAGMEIFKKSRLPPEARKKEAETPRYAHEVRKYGVEILQKARILVVTGAWDHVEKVLDHLSIPHTLLRAQQVKTAGLNPNQVVLVNCEGNLDKDSAERLQWFVNVGGYLMATDWALNKAVQLCFPGTLKQFAGANTGNDVVVVEEGLPGHPFTEGVFEGVPALMWWLEIQALPLVVEYPERCEVIVDSAAMRQRYGCSPMAVTFRWGLGKVQHSISHFYLQEEGMQKASTPRARMVFAADNLGLSLDQIRKILARGGFAGQVNEATMKEMAPDYSMFRMIVNVVREKSKWVEDL